MLFRERLRDELIGRAEDFRAHSQREAADFLLYRGAIDKLCAADPSELSRRFADAENAGAIPSQEIAERRSFDVRFDLNWQNHEQAREWAAGILSGRTTFAADGSQIYAGIETSAPVAAVRIGWFENPHDAAKPYEKDTSFELLTPEDLFRDQEEPMNPDVRVEEMRYLGEVARIGDFLEKKQGWRNRGEDVPLAFFDNPLLVPFSQKSLQKSRLDATVGLVRLSREAEVPLIGYVDRSYSRDILTMLDHFEGEGNAAATTLYDASLLNSRDREGSRLLEHWGDRTCFCYSKRRGLKMFEEAATGRSMVGFVYLRTTAGSPPARLDIPAWIHEMGLLDEIVDVVRAECVVGLGYPYALETADQTAVIPERDSEIFFAALQEFAKREKLGFSVSRKDASKNRRR